MIQQLLNEKGVTDDLADGAIQPGTVTTSGLTAAAQRLLGNKESTAGAIEELTLSQALDLIGSAARGDLLFRGASGWQRLAPGTSGQFLKTLGAGADPAWASGGTGGGAMSLITETVTSGSQATITFSSIPSTYRDLLLVHRVRTSAVVAMYVRFNSDTGTNYVRQFGRVANATFTGLGLAAQTSAQIGTTPSASSHVGAGKTTIYNYRDTNFFKYLTCENGRTDGTTAATQFRDFYSGEWLSTAAINRIDVILDSGTFVDNSVVSLYGCM
jgi:hypothetical protein